MADPSIGATAIVAPEPPMDVAAQTSVLNKLLVASFSVIRLYSPPCSEGRSVVGRNYVASAENN
jgi:hypothetical protein